MTAAPEMKYMTCKKWKPRMDAISPIVQTSMTTCQYSRQLPPIGHLYHRYGGNQRAAADNGHENDTENIQATKICMPDPRCLLGDHPRYESNPPPTADIPLTSSSPRTTLLFLLMPTLYDPNVSGSHGRSANPPQARLDDGVPP